MLYALEKVWGQQQLAGLLEVEGNTVDEWAWFSPADGADWGRIPFRLRPGHAHCDLELGG